MRACLLLSLMLLSSSFSPAMAPMLLARPSGKTAVRHNVAMIVDTTTAMRDTDIDAQCRGERFPCVLAGVRALLGGLSPCRSGESTCGDATEGNFANAVDRVSLFAFPNVTAATAVHACDCSGKDPEVRPYTFPAAGASSYAPDSPETPTYQIVGYSSDYRTSVTTTALNPDSDLVKAVGGKADCPSMQARGGEGTYYAGAIYAAQASLVAERAAKPGSRNVMILTTDGDAAVSRANMSDGGTNSGSYPSWVDDCAQAVTAAKAAVAAGTRVYVVAYGALPSGCPTDRSVSRVDAPCRTLKAIASSSVYFYSDYTQSFTKSTCVSASHATTNLNEIFSDIARSIEADRPVGRVGLRTR
jgi:hypothetical protein